MGSYDKWVTQCMACYARVCLEHNYLYIWITRRFGARVQPRRRQVLVRFVQRPLWYKTEPLLCNWSSESLPGRVQKSETWRAEGRKWEPCFQKVVQQPSQEWRGIRSISLRASSRPSAREEPSQTFVPQERLFSRVCASTSDEERLFQLCGKWGQCLHWRS